MVDLVPKTSLIIPSSPSPPTTTIPQLPKQPSSNPYLPHYVQPKPRRLLSPLARRVRHATFHLLPLPPLPFRKPLLLPRRAVLAQDGSPPQPATRSSECKGLDWGLQSKCNPSRSGRSSTVWYLSMDPSWWRGRGEDPSSRSRT